MADFKIQRFVLQATITTTGVETGFKTFDFTGFTPVADLSRTIIMPAGTTPGIHAGPSAGSASNQSGANATFWLDFLTTSSIRLRIPSSATNVDRSYVFQIIEYIGAAGGANEFVKIADVNKSFTVSETTVFSDSAISGFTDRNKCVVFPRGCSYPDAGQGWQGGLVSFRWGTDNFIVFTRGTTNTTTLDARISIFEFKGSNWTIAHRSIQSVSANPATKSFDIYAEINYDVGSPTIININSWQNAFVVASFSTTTTVDSKFRSWAIIAKNHSTDSNKIEVVTDTSALLSGSQIVVHVLSNPQITVEHSQPADPGTADDNFNITISPALTDLTQASVHAGMVNPSATNSTTVGFTRSVRIVNSTTVNWKTHVASGQALVLYQAVVQWFVVAAPVSHNVDSISALRLSAIHDGGYGHYMLSQEAIVQLDARNCFIGFVRELSLTSSFQPPASSVAVNFMPQSPSLVNESATANVGANFNPALVTHEQNSILGQASGIFPLSFVQTLAAMIEQVAGYRIGVSMENGSRFAGEQSTIAEVGASMMLQISAMAHHAGSSQLPVDSGFGVLHSHKTTVLTNFGLSMTHFSGLSIAESVRSDYDLTSMLRLTGGIRSSVSTDFMGGLSMFEIHTQDDSLLAALFGSLSLLSMMDESEAVGADFESSIGPLVISTQQFARAGIPKDVGLALGQVLNELTMGGKITGVLLRPESRVIHVFRKD